MESGTIKKSICVRVGTFLLKAKLLLTPCNINQWRELMDQPGRLELKLPEEIQLQNWDVILVDGPRGHKYSEEIQGRMSTI